ncbi:site-specific DNA-methyltransferase, partial [Candidatus Poribacteria bacterium]|nr:site-specific DNA-methyltransferase [Candidatus Poribacteria bacterium]
MSFNAKLTDLLKTDPRLVDDEGELVLAAVQDRAWKIDRDLVKLLLSDKEIKAKFFDEIEGHWIFNLNTFIDYISQKNFLDNSYTRFRNRIGLTVGDKYLRERGDVALVWPYKDCVLEGGQTKEEEKRKEIFFNEVLAQDEINRLLDPKVLTHFVRYTAQGKEKVTGFRRDENGVIRENLILKGNNLLALHTLKGQFRGQVKLIYIDPPYNTGNDSFGYNDNFNHSTWLTFMNNRLEVARDLLRQDGSIWINIDDDEAHYLKVLCDDVFGRENFVANVVWEKKQSPQNDAKWLSDSHDHILIYAKNKEIWRPNLLPRTEEMNSRYKNPDNDPRGLWASGGLDVKTYSATYDYPIKTPSGRVVHPPKGYCWRVSKERFEELVKDNRIWFGEDGNNVPRIKRFLSEVQEGAVSKTIWFRSEVGDNQEAKREAKSILGDEFFGTPKPERLLQRIIHIGSIAGDIVLDFQLGSGTTAAVAHKMGRQYIGVEQMDYIESIPVERLKKVMAGEQGGISKAVNWQGGGDFIYLELMKYNEAFMERIPAAQMSDELWQIWREM